MSHDCREDTTPELGEGSLGCQAILASMGEIANVGWWEVNFRTRKIFWSDQVRAIHEVPLDFTPSYAEALSFVAEEDRKRVVSVIQEARVKQTDFRLSARMRTAKGRPFWMRAIGKSVNEGGVCVGIRGVCQDVSIEMDAQRTLREKDDRLKRALTLAQIGLFEWNLGTDMVYWDKGCCLINGIDAEELQVPIDQIRSNVHPEDLPRWKEEIQALKEAGDTLDQEHRLIGADGKTRWVKVRAEIVQPTGEDPRLVGMAINVTEMQLAKEEILRAKDEADRANRAKSDFLAMMNHELRTPLSTIIGPAELALQIAEDPKVRRHLEMAMQSGRHLLDLINRVLDLARIEADGGPREEERIAIRPFLHDFLKPLSATARRSGISLNLEFDCEEEVVLDPVVLRQVLYNLVGNAVKHCGGRQVNIRVRTGEDFLTLEVQDDGCGIGEGETENIFREYQRGSNGSAGMAEGSGLGLAICRRLAEMVGGSMAVNSAPNRGSTFSFHMPLSRSDSVREQQEALYRVPKDFIPRKKLENVRVLIVEDDEANRFFLGALVESIHLHFDAVESGEEAVEIFRPGIHRVVLMDIWLPGIDGKEATRQIRSKAGDESVYVIAQTAGLLEKDGSRIILKEVDHLISKPVSLKGAIEAIQRGLSQSQS